MDNMERANLLFNLMNSLIQLRNERDLLNNQEYSIEKLHASLRLAMKIDWTKKEIELVRAQ
jgi:hypothetical protein